MRIRYSLFILIVIYVLTSCNKNSVNNEGIPVLHYTVSMINPSSHYFDVELTCNNWETDSIVVKMPKWSPGYYQMMNYSNAIDDFTAEDNNGKALKVNKINENSWLLILNKNKSFKIKYEVKADKHFVVNSLLDSTHGYIVPSSVFMFVDNQIELPVKVKIVANNSWRKCATGLTLISGKDFEFYAPNFDILYDCPILVGDLEELPTFQIDGIEHRFIGYKLGNFNREEFILNLEKVVKSGIDIIGDIPYENYTFIGIGPGRGGIEHLNNTTVSFNGEELGKRDAMIRVMNFLAHEYFHHYNVKRIRPFELGPFDYNKENRTNLLWFSEGLTVYYEYIIVKRSGIINEEEFYSNLENSINAFENSPGRFNQSLTQASYNTWDDGPFGRQGKEANKTISYYEKGPSIGLVLDFAIRNATQNKKSLDDVMRFLYWEYYKKLNRGFTDAELQQVCEFIAGISLSDEFEYVNTTKEIDYSKYFAYAGLNIEMKKDKISMERIFNISRKARLSDLESSILNSWLGY